jgi:hypothetical protein
MKRYWVTFTWFPDWALPYGITEQREISHQKIKTFKDIENIKRKIHEFEYGWPIRILSWAIFEE